MRARDVDRTTAIDALDRAYTDGQLSYEEHRSRVENARAAKTLGELHSLVSDLQLSTDLPEPPPVPRRRGFRPAWLLIVAALVVVAGAAGLIVFASVDGDESSTATDTSEQPAAPPAPVPTDVTPIIAPPAVFDTPDGLRRFIAEYSKKFGDTIVIGATVYPEGGYANVTRAVASDRKQAYNYRGGFEPTGPPTRLNNEPPIDLAALNVDALAAVMAQMPQLIGVPDATLGHASIDIAADGPRISIYANNEAGESGYVIVGPGGEIRQVRPFTN